LFQREIEALEGYIKLYWYTVLKLVRALYYRKGGCGFESKCETNKPYRQTDTIFVSERDRGIRRLY